MSTVRTGPCTGRGVVLEDPPPLRSVPQAACPFCDGNESLTPPEIARPGCWTTLDHDFHWHMAILPRSAPVAGFEVGTGFYSNPVSPEHAAAVLRDGLERISR